MTGSEHVCGLMIEIPNIWLDGEVKGEPGVAVGSVELKMRGEVEAHSGVGL